MYTDDNISLIYSWNEKSFRQKLHRKSKYTFYAQLCLSENLLVYEVNVEKYGTAGQATDESTVRRIKYAIFMPNT